MTAIEEIKALRQEIADLRQEVGMLRLQPPTIHYHYHGQQGLLQAQYQRQGLQGVGNMPSTWSGPSSSNGAAYQ